MSSSIRSALNRTEKNGDADSISNRPIWLRPSYALTSKKRKRMQECFICCNEVEADQVPRLAHSRVHALEAAVCFGCWEQHIATKIEERSWNAILCLQCEHVLEEPDIRLVASESTYGR